MVASFPCTVRLVAGIFPIVAHSVGTVAVNSNVARNAGSSQHGNTRRASVDSIWVDSIKLSLPSGFVYGCANRPCGRDSMRPE